MAIPDQYDLYYDGGWHAPTAGGYSPSHNPANGSLIAHVAQAESEDVDRAVLAAAVGSRVWRDVPPLERARLLREVAAVIRQNAKELAQLDALDRSEEHTSELQSLMRIS